MKWIMIVPLCLVLTFCQSEKADDSNFAVQPVGVVLDLWHQSASDGDFDSYFNAFENDQAVFMGTDATERWTVDQFKIWAKPIFDRGKAWSFAANRRFIDYNSDSTVAWFDEELSTTNLGPCRGTGVLKLTDSGWKISHYNLSIPIPNQMVRDLVIQIDSVNNFIETP